MEIQQGKGPWASPVNGIVPLGTTLTMVVGIDDKEGKHKSLSSKNNYSLFFIFDLQFFWLICFLSILYLSDASTYNYRVFSTIYYNI